MSKILAVDVESTLIHSGEQITLEIDISGKNRRIECCLPKEVLFRFGNGTHSLTFSDGGTVRRTVIISFSIIGNGKVPLLLKTDSDTFPFDLNVVI